jgi:hypothetical protein
MSSTLQRTTGELQGKYYPFTSEEKKQLIDDHFLFSEPSTRSLSNCGAAHD